MMRSESLIVRHSRIAHLHIMIRIWLHLQFHHEDWLQDTSGQRVSGIAWMAELWRRQLAPRVLVRRLNAPNPGAGIRACRGTER